MLFHAREVNLRDHPRLPKVRWVRRHSVDFTRCATLPLFEQRKASFTSMKARQLRLQVHDQRPTAPDSYKLTATLPNRYVPSEPICTESLKPP